MVAVFTPHIDRPDYTVPSARILLIWCLSCSVLVCRTKSSLAAIAHLGYSSKSRSGRLKKPGEYSDDE
jgi:hypothetical protein